MRFATGQFSATTTWPLVVRELRMESRRGINYGLRVLTASVLVAGLAGFLATTLLDPSQLGGALFNVLYTSLLLAMWIVVPMMTADCVSREKREGTLGLLFLTPLTVTDVLVGKAATHVLRAVTLLLASMPMLVLPFILGGVDWQQGVIGVVMLANALLLGMAAGLYASAKGGSAIQVMVMAEVYALAPAVITAIFASLSGATAAPGVIGLAWVVVTTLYFTLLVFALMISASVRVLRETWDQDPAAPEKPRWVVLFSDSEYWRELFHWEHSRTLDNNPMSWLQEYSWTARLTKWGWFLSMLVAEFFEIFGFPGYQQQLIIIVSLGLAFSATGSFRRERQTGLLEVLLVTPLSARQLMIGRLWGIFCHFSPALVLLMVCWDGDRQLNYKQFDSNPFSAVVPNPIAFGSLMVTGLYLSLWRLNFLVVWLLAWALAFFLPAVATITLMRMGGFPLASSVGFVSFYQLILGVICWFLMHRNLEERRFVNKDAA